MKNMLSILLLSFAFQPSQAYSDILDMGSKAVERGYQDAALNLVFEANDLPRYPIQSLEVTDEEAVIDLKRNREIHTYRLTNKNHPALQNIKISLSFPKNWSPQKKYSVVYLLPGLYSDKDIIYYIENPGENIIASFEYAYMNLSIAQLQDLKSLSRSILASPLQVAASMAWLLEKPWVDKSRFNLMGVSLGAYLLPLCQRVAQSQGISFHSSVLAYAGTDLHKVLVPMLEAYMGDREAKILGEALRILFSPFDPEMHLPHLRGKFLVVYGDNDKLVPLKTSEKMFRLLPTSKSYHVIPGDHIGVDKPDLIRALNNIAFSWLQETSSID